MGAKDIAKSMEQKDLLTSHRIIVNVALTPVLLILQLVKGLMCILVIKREVIANIFQSDATAHKTLLYLHMVYCLSNYLEYLILDVNFSNGKLCEDAGAIPLVDEKSCRNAVEEIKNSVPGAYFQSLMNTWAYPKGCLLKFYGKLVYFNSHESGSRAKDAQPICRKSNGK